jgi:hypothetical protein
MVNWWLIALRPRHSRKKRQLHTQFFAIGWSANQLSLKMASKKSSMSCHIVLAGTQWFMYLTWLVGTRDSRTQSTRACKPWVSGPRYLALRTWVSGPRQTHKYRTPKALHPTVVLSFSRHFSLCPVVTDTRTDACNKWLYI